MKTYKEISQELDDQRLEEQIERLLDEGKVGLLAKSAAATLRAKQAAFSQHVTQEQDIGKKLDLISDQIASMSSMFLVVLSVQNKDRDQNRTRNRR